MTRLKIILFTLLIAHLTNAQKYVLDSVKPLYPFVNWDNNQLLYAKESPAFQKLYHKLDTIAHNGIEKVHMFHIGGSHIQADIYSNKLRSYFQNMSQTSKGQRGLIFPFKMAHTNNPKNYKVTFTGAWEGHRCSVVKDSVAMGLTGISASFTGDTAQVKIWANYHNYKEHMYRFNKLRVFYNDWEENYEVQLPDSVPIQYIHDNKNKHYIEFGLRDEVESMNFNIQKIDSLNQHPFLMMGLELMNDRPGIEYTTIGVNGASFKFYNRSAFFKEQLLMYQPDLFIISIGTNDTYTKNFNVERFKNYYEKMMLEVLESNPEAAILLTVPNDSYYKRKYANPNTKKAQQVIHQLAQQYKMAVWDFYDIMGGYGASQKWYLNKLMPKDRIHFTKKGYSIKADLMLEAITKSWETSLDLNPKSILNQIVHHE